MTNALNLTDQAQRRLDAVLAVTQAIQTTLDLNALFRTVIKVLHSVLPFDAAYIALYHASDRSLSFEFQADEGIEESFSAHYPLDSYVILKHVVERGEVVCFADLEDAKQRFPTFQRRTFGQEEKRSRSWIAAPMLAAGGTQGILSLQSYAAGLYGPAEEQLVMTLAGQIAGAIANARLLAQLEAQVRELETPLILVAPGIMVAPLVGAFDDARAARLATTVLAAVKAQSLRRVLLDLTGVVAVDQRTARHLVDLTAMLRLLGTAAHLVGLRPALAQALVELGVSWEGIAIAPNVAAALRAL